ncbi:MAG: hypothetical protein C0483_13350 [Pirellula sp.]|nr:hypothetical protein [Pirellula sp.]
MSRETFLARVRQAAAAGRAYRVHVQPGITAEMGRAAHGADLVVEFIAEVTKAGGRPVVVRTPEEAKQQLVELFRFYEPRSALCWQHPVLEKLQLAEFLPSHGVEQIDFAVIARQDFDHRRGTILAADIGITSADCAVAETGSLVMAHGAGLERIASLLPPVFVAVVERAQIVPDLFDVVAHFGGRLPEKLPSNITFITGPSKTGDIESKLVTGVHGPGKWHVIVIDPQ